MKLSKRKMRVKEIRKLRILSESQKEQWLEELYDKITENPEVVLTKTEVEFVKSCINEVAGEDLDFHMVSRFICATRDRDFIKQCLENENFQFEDYQRVDMIRNTNNVEYIKTSIEENKLPSHFVPMLVRHLINIENFRSYTQYIGSLIRTDEYPAEIKAELIKSIKEYKEIPDDIYIAYVEMCMEDEKCALNSKSKADLILSMKDLEIMQQKHKTQNGKCEYSEYELQISRYFYNEKIGLDGFDKANLIIGCKDFNYYTQCILDKKTGLSSGNISQIIRVYQQLPEIDSRRYSRILLSFLTSSEVDINGFDRAVLIKELENFPELKEANVENETFGKLSQYDCFLTTLLKQHLDGKKELDVFERLEMLKSISNNNLIGMFIQSKIIPKEYIPELVLSRNDKEFALKCVELDKKYVGTDGRTKILIGLNDEDILKQYVQREDFFKGPEKTELILALKDEEYVKKCIHDKTLQIKPVDRAVLIAKGIKDEAYRQICLHDETLDWDIMAYVALMDEIGSEEEKEEWNNKFIRIKSIADISLNELEQTDKEYIELQEGIYPFYTKEEFTEIKKALEEILEGIEIPEKGDEESELKAFLEIAKRLANHISYDQYAASNEGEKDYNIQRECRNLYGGLVKGEAVCAGYANILKQTLACVGIESKYISGYREESEDGHAWNQVKIGDKWYNVDLTWERDEIVRTGVISKEILKSDQEFENHMQYSVGRPVLEEKCTSSMKERNNMSSENILKENFVNENIVEKDSQEEVDV